MKYIIAFFILSISFQTQAANHLWTCFIPSDEVEILLRIEHKEESSVDYTVFELNDEGQKTIFFNQEPLGEITAQVQTGNVNLILMTETSEDESGVIRDAGLIIMKKSDVDPSYFDGTFSTQGNVYLFACNLE